MSASRAPASAVALVDFCDADHRAKAGLDNCTFCGRLFRIRRLRGGRNFRRAVPASLRALVPQPDRTSDSAITDINTINISFFMYFSSR